MPVPEIQPEQLGIVAVAKQDGSVHTAPAARAAGALSGRLPPIPDRAPGHASAAEDLAVVEPGLGQ